MEELFYQIPKSIANLVGEFEYKSGMFFNPKCNEQVDGTYLVSKSLIDELIDYDNIKQVDWSILTLINSSQINSKS